MRLMLLNPNTTEAMTADMERQANRYARAGTEIEGFTAKFGAESVECAYEEEFAIMSFLQTIRERADAFDGVILSCFGDPGLYACRELSPVPVVGIAEASMLMACTVAHKWSIVTVIPRVKPMAEHLVRFHGLEQRCASIRTTPLSVLDCEREPERAVREMVKASQAAVAEDGAEAILLGCGGMGPLDDEIAKAVDVPVIDGIVCAVKLLEGLHDYGLKTSRHAAFMRPEPKDLAGVPGLGGVSA
ncbi:aspartate/glutamate racemase family protein [Capillimicrobium parvum]|uniref:Hydantoin racemase n=1 Tax=Capillimicrobium parvum TaxID=2884022 RepID=A0A9E6XUB3_9ACTN|nr:aspartate/glutamate racemase family protein [Capillimicrobium parvum]UGS34519.1 Hydantoin racemase [Capillimicrobium parvum]